MNATTRTILARLQALRSQAILAWDDDTEQDLADIDARMDEVYREAMMEDRLAEAMGLDL